MKDEWQRTKGRGQGQGEQHRKERRERGRALQKQYYMQHKRHPLSGVRSRIRRGEKQSAKPTGTPRSIFFHSEHAGVVRLDSQLRRLEKFGVVGTRPCKAPTWVSTLITLSLSLRLSMYKHIKSAFLWICNAFLWFLPIQSQWRTRIPNPTQISDLSRS